MLGIFRSVARRKGKGEGGQTLVEFTLVLPIFVLVMFAIVDFGLAFHAWITVTNAAREGARVGAVRATNADIEQRVRDTAQTLDQANLSVAPSCPPSPACPGQPGGSVVVDVSYRYSLITPLADLLNLVSGGTIPSTLTLSSTADMRLE
jgi:hypothetical protein